MADRLPGGTRASFSCLLSVPGTLATGVVDERPSAVASLGVVRQALSIDAVKKCGTFVSWMDTACFVRGA